MSGSSRLFDLLDLAEVTYQLPDIEWLSDNGSCYVAEDTRSFARDIGPNRERRCPKFAMNRAMIAGDFIQDAL